MTAVATSIFPSRKWLIGGLVFVHFLLAITYFISDSFTGSGFDESVVYLLHTGVDGFDTSGYRYLAGSTLVLIIIGLYLCIRIGKSRFLSNPRNAGLSLGITFLLAAALFLQPVFNLLATQPLYDLITRQKPPSIKLAIPGKIDIPDKKNIVFLYLEGFERSFLDTEQFPGLASNMRELEQRGLAFTNIADLYGTRWTIAGMVASQCGLPLEPVTDADKPGSFMPRAVCLGDVLKQNGYSLSYLGGASLRFGNKGNFYRSHQFDTVLGLENHLESLPLGSKPYSHWGLYDEDLFELAREEYSRLATKNDPFALFLLTLDTHPPSGYPSASCDGLEYADGKNLMLNALRCSDRLVSDFVLDLLTSDADDNTVFVIASDHLALKNDAYAQLGRLPARSNLFFILEKHGDSRAIDRPGSLLDIAPTLLSHLGAEADAYNLGRNLLGDRQTIMENFEDPDDVIRLWTGRLAEFY